MAESARPDRRAVFRPSVRAGGGPLSALFAGLMSFLAPPRCRACRAALLDHSNPFLCRRCAGSVEWIGAGACRSCGFPAGPHAKLGPGCARCRGKDLGLTAAAAVARYRRGARGLVLALKFSGETEIAAPMAGLMAERFRAAGFGEADCVVPVALHPERRRTRGFDQARLLGERLSLEIGLPLLDGGLRRVRHTRPQSSLDRGSRLDNPRDAFLASPEMAGARPLLVDDVMTTGATLKDCARACRAAGARRVYALVFAR